jgi:Rrf2 family protein
VSLSSIATTHGVSALFLKKLARALRIRKIIESKEGYGGGYVLMRDPLSLSVWDVVTAVQTVKPVNSVKPGDCPVNAKCIPQKIRQTIDSALEQSLSRIMIAEFL